MRHALALLLLVGCPKSAPPTTEASSGSLLAQAGEAEISGTLAVESAHRSLSVLARSGSECAAEHGGVPGVITVAYTVIADGSVADVAVRSISPSVNEATAACIAGSGMVSAFAVQGEGEAVVAVPVRLYAP